MTYAFNVCEIGGNIFHSKKILKPDVPPPGDEESFERLGQGLIWAAIGLCCVAGAIAIILIVA